MFNNCIKLLNIYGVQKKLFKNKWRGVIFVSFVFNPISMFQFKKSLSGIHKIKNKTHT